MRLIDADELPNRLRWFDEYDHILYEDVKHYIDGIPTVDAVEVVRCKDCKHRQGNACDYSAVWVRPNGFCQWGERKEEEEE